jgi:hypothetical protein
MAKKTTKDCFGTSFHDYTIRASYNDLVQAIGEPQYAENTGRDKVNYQWDMETSYGNLFTIYDWKEYRCVRDNTIIEWHIGALSSEDSALAQNELENLLSEIS